MGELYMIFVALFFMISACSSEIFSKTHFAGIQIIEPRYVFKTREEIRNLFDQLDIRYLDSMEYQYTDILKPNIAKLLRNPAAYLDLYEKYCDDIKYNKFAPMCVAYINDDIGFGVFATAPIFKGDFIGVYMGVIKSKNGKDDPAYTWEHPGDPLRSDIKLECDATYAANELRYVNHSFAPNVKKVDILCNNRWYVCYVAQEDIEPGEQILVSYGMGYWTTTNRPYYDSLNAFVRIEV